MKKWLAILIIVILPMAIYFGLDKYSQNATAKGAVSIPQGAKVIRFSSKMCSDCVKMEKELKGIEEEFSNITFVKIDVSNMDKATSKLVDKYGITLVPALAYINNDETTQEVIQGYHTKKEVVNHIKKIK